MEIEVGEYVRTNKGTIHKIERRDRDKHLLIDTAYLGARYFTYIEEKEDIVKHSKNIIDLIEVGDYVNGYYTRKMANYNNELCVFDLNVMQWVPLTEIDVLYSIVTHEQFESIEYNVEEDK